MKRWCLFLFSLLLLNAGLKADSFSLAFNQYTTDNVFQSQDAESDRISSLSLYFDKNLAKISLFSEGSYSYFNKNHGLSSYLHDIGLDYLQPLNDKAALYFSLIGRGAFYRQEYSDFNYYSFNFRSNLKAYLSQTSILKSSYTFEYKKFRYSLFDFVSHLLFASFDTYLQTKTTLKSELNWGYKYFLHPYSSAVVPDQNGRGYRGGREPNIYVPRAQDDGKGIQILSLTALVAQGLGNRLGLMVSGLRQWNLSGENPFASVEEFYAAENPSYDVFSWAGYQFSSQLTLELVWYVELKIGYTMAHKEFPGIESMDLEGNPLGVIREDEKRQVEAVVEKDFPKFSLFLSYSYVDNDSNDPFFRWKGHFFSAGVEWNLFFGEKK